MTPSPTLKNARFLIGLFFGFIFLIICKTFQDYGVTWDEEYHQTYGTLIIQWYQSFFKDAVAVQHDFLIFYGGFFDALVRLANYVSFWGPYETRHFLNALFGLWAIFMSFKIARHIAGYLAGFLSALFLLLHPVFYGHMFNNPVDIPFAALFLTTIYLTISTYENLPRLPMKDLVKLGLWNENLKNKIIAANGSVQNIPEIPENIKPAFSSCLIYFGLTS